MSAMPASNADTPWKEPLHDPGPVVVFDIDGVLADMRPFKYLIEAETSRQKQWKEFHRKFEKAAPIKAGLITAKRIYNELEIDLAYSTTRPEQHARRTLRWLENHDLPMGPILFRHFVRDGPRSVIDVKLRHWCTGRTTGLSRTRCWHGSRTTRPPCTPCAHTAVQRGALTNSRSPLASTDH